MDNKKLNKQKYLRITFMAVAFVIVLGFTGILLVTLWLDSPAASVESTQTITSPQSELINEASLDSAYATNSLGILYFTILLLSIATAISVSISFYLYKWRKILLENSEMLVPEELGKHLQSIASNLQLLSNHVVKSTEIMAAETSDNTGKIKSMTSTYMELHDVLDNKDKEINRLKRGYDAEIFRKFISRFARVVESIDDFLVGSTEIDSLRQIQRLFEDAFDECGVTKFQPEIGDDYRISHGVADGPKIQYTETFEDDFKICEIIQTGYMLCGGESNEVIIPSKVRIQQFKGDES